ncbi:FAD-dependent monooxygenase [Hamadaea tsunoensis]|uniref:FAD-dependent monooxygenase n=1 Tax=Hamadaea tsunoensis TaxID=53368 RepID=UPI000408490C|nr:FAD-dependent monooxygenase [Hamadaea tsunoensis]
MRVLVSGASIGGPALAYWLARFGYQPTVVEIAGRPREGGYAVDFRGSTHMAVLGRMGVLDDLRAVRTAGHPMTFVDRAGRPTLALPADFAGGDLEVTRADLSAVLRRHGEALGARYVYGDHLTGIEQDDEGVRVAFASGRHDRFDLVIGADGVHSGVRRLAFGPESAYVRHLGAYVAGWDVPDVWGGERRSLLYTEPGRMAGVGIGEGNAAAFFVFRSPELTYDRRDPGQQKRILRDAYAGMGWETGRLLAGLETATDLFFDSINRVDLPRWSAGRVALVGDAGYGATLGGMGTGTAVVGAYVLAHELRAADGDHRVAFAHYEELLRPYAERCQKGGDTTGRFFAPGSRLGITLRDKTLSIPAMMRWMMKAGESRTNNIDLPDYPFSRSDSASAVGTNQR